VHPNPTSLAATVLHDLHKKHKNWQHVQINRFFFVEKKKQSQYNETGTRAIVVMGGDEGRKITHENTTVMNRLGAAIPFYRAGNFKGFLLPPTYEHRYK